MNIEIKKAELTDLPAILELEKKMVAEEIKFASKLDKKGKISLFYPKSEIKKIILSRNCYLSLAKIKDITIGCGFARIEKPEKKWLKYKRQGYLGMLYVEKRFRRQGIAQSLQKERIKWLKSKGIKFCVNNILAENIPSLKFQKKRGFKPYIIQMYKKI